MVLFRSIKYIYITVHRSLWCFRVANRNAEPIEHLLSVVPCPGSLVTTLYLMLLWFWLFQTVAVSRNLQSVHSELVYCYNVLEVCLCSRVWQFLIFKSCVLFHCVVTPCFLINSYINSHASAPSSRLFWIMLWWTWGAHACLRAHPEPFWIESWTWGCSSSVCDVWAASSCACYTPASCVHLSICSAFLSTLAHSWLLMVNVISCTHLPVCIFFGEMFKGFASFFFFPFFLHSWVLHGVASPALELYFFKFWGRILPTGIEFLRLGSSL